MSRLYDYRTGLRTDDDYHTHNGLARRDAYHNHRDHSYHNGDPHYHVGKGLFHIIDRGPEENNDE